MYKNFSYAFGLGALLLLAACDNGEKKSTDRKQETITEPQKITVQKEEIKPIKEISSENRTDNQKSKIKENDIYSDINKPIDLGATDSTDKDDTNASAQVNIEEKKNNENIIASPQNEKPVVNTESASDTALDSTLESNPEKEAQEKSQKIEEDQQIDMVNTVESPKIEETKTENAANNVESPKIEDTQSMNISNTAESSVTEEISTVTANEVNTENSDKVPKISAESNAPAVSEGPIEEKSSEEVSLDSEPAPIIEETSDQEAVSETKI